MNVSSAKIVLATNLKLAGRLLLRFPSDDGAADAFLR